MSKSRKDEQQYILCVKDNRHIFNEEVYKLTGLTLDEVRKKNKVSLGFQILPGQQVIIKDDYLHVDKLQYNLSVIQFVYDYQGISEEIKQKLVSAGCHYVRISSPQGWFKVERMGYQKALTVDAMRFSFGLNNVFWRSNLSNRLALVQTLRGFSSEKQKWQLFVDAICNAYLYGYNCHTSVLCNLSEASAADITWMVTNELISTFDFAISNRVSNRLYLHKRITGNYQTMACTKGDVLFNYMFILCEEELWNMLDELGLKYLGVGGFSHFSYYSDLSWMGLVLDLCEALKFAGHIKLVQAILDKRITNSLIDKLDVFKGEIVYVVNKRGEEVLYKLKQKLFSEPCYFNGKTYQTFREACKQFIVEFDNLFSAIHQKFLEKQLMVKIIDCEREIHVKFWRLATQWTSLDIEVREQMKDIAFRICQDEIKKANFKPLVYYPTKRIAEKVEQNLTCSNSLSLLFEDREKDFLEENNLPPNKFSPRVIEYCNRFEELEIEWIRSK
ncbi:MAG: hypothetical protein HZR80_02600 [Candidatus Heimdallarchaeota archaeon]